jgi:NAD(P)-dependent dehydrogenase (short-subunit alcohol dehydrogenase family)
VNALAPGPFRTPLNDGIDDDPHVRRFLDAEVPMRRWAAPEGEGLLRRAVPGEAGGIVAGNSDPDPVAGRDDGGDGQQLHGQAHGVPGNHAKGV